MTVTAAQGAAARAWLPVTDAASLPVDEVLHALDTSDDGLDEAEVAGRRAALGPNAVQSHRVSVFAVVVRQLRSPLLGLLVAAAAVSALVGESTDAIVIAVILAASVGLGFVNEYRAERAGAALHEQIRHKAVVLRTGTPSTVDVIDLVPGDVVRLELGGVVPADIRLVTTEELACDEAVLTGESASVHKTADAVAPGTALADLTSAALMGTVVRAGSATGVVVATGHNTVFGRIAAGLADRVHETEFQAGLRRFSGMLAWVAGILTVVIFVINLILHRALIDAVLFSLAIAVGITPQLLPAIVTTSLAVGTRALGARGVLVKRLVCVEDLGNTQVLFTDKTGTLTEGRLTLRAALAPDGTSADRPLLLGLLANEATVKDGMAVGGNQLDSALWRSTDAARQPVSAYRRLTILPFDHDRLRVSALVDGADGRLLVVKGAPERLLDLCVDVPPSARAVLDDELARGARIIAVASRPAPNLTDLGADSERDLHLDGYLSFTDPPKTGAAEALSRLSQLGITTKIITGDHPISAVLACTDLGVAPGTVCTGADISTMDDGTLKSLVASTTVFARVSPEDKARIVGLQRRAGVDVAFLGDGVNDALALHAADVGISVDSATDVAKDAADVIMLRKDLGVLAEAVTEGRRIFANTIKYVLMATSSNFGNMFSAAGASAFLPFLPMLPSQILLNNLIYDSTQIAIPGDRVDPEQLARPAHWDLQQIRRFMLTFGPVSSLFDFLIFAILLQMLHAVQNEFQTGWFVESLATQILVVFVIRTHRSPFWRSRPSRVLIATVLAGVVVAAILPYTPLADPLGFTRLPAVYAPIVVVLVATYLVLVEITKRHLFHPDDIRHPVSQRAATRPHRVRRRADRFSSGGQSRFARLRGIVPDLFTRSVRAAGVGAGPTARRPADR
jgi:P-type Mg2+ transporter